MQIRTIGIMSPGDMGHGVGRALREGGRRVLTCLAGRSERTRGLAAKAGMEDAGSLERLVAEADVVLSIMPPAAAVTFAESAAAAMRSAGRTPLYADLNAISPETTRRIQQIIEPAGAAYVDGGIIGRAPGVTQMATRVYVSGPEAGRLEELAGETLLVRNLGPETADRASTIKMIYAGLNKGTWALQAATLIAAERHGVLDAYFAELEYSQQAMLEAMKRWVGFLAADAERWHPEMVEIAETYGAVGVTTGFHRGAEDVYRLLAETPLAAETRETWDVDRPLREAIRIYAETLAEKIGAEKKAAGRSAAE